MSRLVLVTGATGFAGSHVMEALLAAGFRVRIPVRPSSSLRWVAGHAGLERFTADLRDPGSLRALTRDVSWIFHFGGITRARRRDDFFRINTRGTQDLYEAARAADAKPELFLFCSSLAASGPAPSAGRPRREEDPPAPIGPYGESKLAAERWLEAQREPGMRLLVLRPPTVYGPRDTALLTLMRWARRGILPLPAPRGSRASLVHARDLAAACLFLAEGGHVGLFHAGDGILYSWEEVGELLGRILERRLQAVRVPSWLARLAGLWGAAASVVTGRLPVINPEKVRDLIQPYWITDIDRLRSAGFDPQIGLEEGMRETLEWYRAEGWL